MSAPHEPLDPHESDAVGRRIQELTATVAAPASLRARLDTGADRARPRRRLALPVAGLTAAVAAVAIALVVALGGGGDQPSFDDAAALALARPTAAAPAIDASDTTLVDARVGDVQFPNYAYVWPKWRTAGARKDRVSGRAATTVVYRGPRGDVGYTIVDGKPLAEPSGARHISAHGVRYAILRRGDATVVTWRRAGHTCILAGRGAGVEEQLVKFATWA
jgi:hypothetical protein